MFFPSTLEITPPFSFSNNINNNFNSSRFEFRIFFPIKFPLKNTEKHVLLKKKIIIVRKSNQRSFKIVTRINSSSTIPSFAYTYHIINHPASNPKIIPKTVCGYKKKKRERENSHFLAIKIRLASPETRMKRRPNEIEKRPSPNFFLERSSSPYVIPRARGWGRGGAEGRWGWTVAAAVRIFLPTVLTETGHA